MYFFNLPHSIANMARLVRGTTGQAPDKARLRQQYVQALVRAQGHALSDAPLPAVSFYERRICQGTEPFAQGFGDIRPLPPDEQQQVRERLGQSMALLEQVDRRLLEWVQLLISDLVFVKGDLAGAITARWMVGVISLLPSPEWDAVRYAETIIHETVHNNVHLSDLLTPLFREPGRLKEPDSLVPSAIRVGQLRPLNGAYHSACVAVVVAYVRHLFGDREGVDTILGQLSDCVKGLATKAHLLTDYANANVEQMQGFVARPDFKALARGFVEPGLALYRPLGSAA